MSSKNKRIQKCKTDANNCMRRRLSKNHPDFGHQPMSTSSGYYSHNNCHQGGGGNYNISPYSQTHYSSNPSWSGHVSGPATTNLYRGSADDTYRGNNFQTNRFFGSLSQDQRSFTGFPALLPTPSFSGSSYRTPVDASLRNPDYRTTRNISSSSRSTPRWDWNRNRLCNDEEGDIHMGYVEQTNHFIRNNKRVITLREERKYSHTINYDKRHIKKIVKKVIKKHVREEDSDSRTSSESSIPAIDSYKQRASTKDIAYSKKIKDTSRSDTKYNSTRGCKDSDINKSESISKENIRNYPSSLKRITDKNVVKDVSQIPNNVVKKHSVSSTNEKKAIHNEIVDLTMSDIVDLNSDIVDLTKSDKNDLNGKDDLTKYSNIETENQPHDDKIKIRVHQNTDTNIIFIENSTCPKDSANFTNNAQIQDPNKMESITMCSNKFDKPSDTAESKNIGMEIKDCSMENSNATKDMEFKKDNDNLIKSNSQDKCDDLSCEVSKNDSLDYCISFVEEPNDIEALKGEGKIIGKKYTTQEELQLQPAQIHDHLSTIFITTSKNFSNRENCKTQCEKTNLSGNNIVSSSKNQTNLGTEGETINAEIASDIADEPRHTAENNNLGMEKDRENMISNIDLTEVKDPKAVSNDFESRNHQNLKQKCTAQGMKNDMSNSKNSNTVVFDEKSLSTESGYEVTIESKNSCNVNAPSEVQVAFEKQSTPEKGSLIQRGKLQNKNDQNNNEEKGNKLLTNKERKHKKRNCHIVVKAKSIYRGHLEQAQSIDAELGIDEFHKRYYKTRYCFSPRFRCRDHGGYCIYPNHDSHSSEKSKAFNNSVEHNTQMEIGINNNTSNKIERRHHETEPYRRNFCERHNSRTLSENWCSHRVDDFPLVKYPNKVRKDIYHPSCRYQNNNARKVHVNKKCHACNQQSHISCNEVTLFNAESHFDSAEKCSKCNYCQCSLHHQPIQNIHHPLSNNYLKANHEKVHDPISTGQKLNGNSFPSSKETKESIEKMLRAALRKIIPPLKKKYLSKETKKRYRKGISSIQKLKVQRRNHRVHRSPRAQYSPSKQSNLCKDQLGDDNPEKCLEEPKKNDTNPKPIFEFEILKSKTNKNEEYMHALEESNEVAPVESGKVHESSSHSNTCEEIINHNEIDLQGNLNTHINSNLIDSNRSVSFEESNSMHELNTIGTCDTEEKKYTERKESEKSMLKVSINLNLIKSEIDMTKGIKQNETDNLASILSQNDSENSFSHEKNISFHCSKKQKRLDVSRRSLQKQTHKTADLLNDLKYLKRKSTSLPESVAKKIHFPKKQNDLESTACKQNFKIKNDILDSKFNESFQKNRRKLNISYIDECNSQPSTNPRYQPPLKSILKRRSSEDNGRTFTMKIIPRRHSTCVDKISHSKLNHSNEVMLRNDDVNLNYKLKGPQEITCNQISPMHFIENKKQLGKTGVKHVTFVDDSKNEQHNSSSIVNSNHYPETDFDQKVFKLNQNSDHSFPQNNSKDETKSEIYSKSNSKAHLKDKIITTKCEWGPQNFIKLGGILDKPKICTIAASKITKGKKRVSRISSNSANVQPTWNNSNKSKADITQKQYLQQNQYDSQKSTDSNDEIYKDTGYSSIQDFIQKQSESQDSIGFSKCIQSASNNQCVQRAIITPKIHKNEPVIEQISPSESGEYETGILRNNDIKHIKLLSEPTVLNRFHTLNSHEKFRIDSTIATSSEVSKKLAKMSYQSLNDTCFFNHKGQTQLKKSYENAKKIKSTSKQSKTNPSLNLNVNSCITEETNDDQQCNTNKSLECSKVNISSGVTKTPTKINRKASKKTCMNNEEINNNDHKAEVNNVYEDSTVTLFRENNKLFKITNTTPNNHTAIEKRETNNDQDIIKELDKNSRNKESSSEIPQKILKRSNLTLNKTYTSNEKEGPYDDQVPRITTSHPKVSEKDKNKTLNTANTKCTSSKEKKINHNLRSKTAKSFKNTILKPPSFEAPKKWTKLINQNTSNTNEKEKNINDKDYGIINAHENLTIIESSSVIPLKIRKISNPTPTCVSIKKEKTNQDVGSIIFKPPGNVEIISISSEFSKKLTKVINATTRNTSTTYKKNSDNQEIRTKKSNENWSIRESSSNDSQKIKVNNQTTHNICNSTIKEKVHHVVEHKTRKISSPADVSKKMTKSIDQTTKNTSTTFENKNYNFNKEIGTKKSNENSTMRESLYKVSQKISNKIFHTTNNSFKKEESHHSVEDKNKPPINARMIKSTSEVPKKITKIINLTPKTTSTLNEEVNANNHSKHHLSQLNIAPIHKIDTHTTPHKDQNCKVASLPNSELTACIKTHIEGMTKAKEKNVPEKFVSISKTLTNSSHIQPKKLKVYMGDADSKEIAISKSISTVASKSLVDSKKSNDKLEMSTDNCEYPNSGNVKPQVLHRTSTLVGQDTITISNIDVSKKTQEVETCTTIITDDYIVPKEEPNVTNKEPLIMKNNYQKCLDNGLSESLETAYESLQRHLPKTLDGENYTANKITKIYSPSLESALTILPIQTHEQRFLTKAQLDYEKQRKEELANCPLLSAILNSAEEIPKAPVNLRILTPGEIDLKFRKANDFSISYDAPGKPNCDSVTSLPSGNASTSRNIDEVIRRVSISSDIEVYPDPISTNPPVKNSYSEHSNVSAPCSKIPSIEQLVSYSHLNSNTPSYPASDNHNTLSRRRSDTNIKSSRARTLSTKKPTAQKSQKNSQTLSGEFYEYSTKSTSDPITWNQLGQENSTLGEKADFSNSFIKYITKWNNHMDNQRFHMKTSGVENNERVAPIPIVHRHSTGNKYGENQYVAPIQNEDTNMWLSGQNCPLYQTASVTQFGKNKSANFESLQQTGWMPCTQNTNGPHGTKTVDMNRRNSYPQMKPTYQTPEIYSQISTFSNIPNSSDITGSIAASLNCSPLTLNNGNISYNTPIGENANYNDFHIPSPQSISHQNINAEIFQSNMNTHIFQSIQPTQNMNAVYQTTYEGSISHFTPMYQSNPMPDIYQNRNCGADPNIRHLSISHVNQLHQNISEAFQNNNLSMESSTHSSCHFPVNFSSSYHPTLDESNNNGISNSEAHSLLSTSSITPNPTIVFNNSLSNSQNLCQNDSDQNYRPMQNITQVDVSNINPSHQFLNSEPNGNNFPTQSSFPIDTLQQDTCSQNIFIPSLTLQNIAIDKFNPIETNINGSSPNVVYFQQNSTPIETIPVDPKEQVYESNLVEGKSTSAKRVQSSKSTCRRFPDSSSLPVTQQKVTKTNKSMPRAKGSLGKEAWVLKYLNSRKLSVDTTEQPILGLSFEPTQEISFLSSMPSSIETANSVTDTNFTNTLSRSEQTKSSTSASKICSYSSIRESTKPYVIETLRGSKTKPDQHVNCSNINLLRSQQINLSTSDSAIVSYSAVTDLTNPCIPENQAGSNKLIETDESVVCHDIKKKNKQLHKFRKKETSKNKSKEYFSSNATIIESQLTTSEYDCRVVLSPIPMNINLEAKTVRTETNELSTNNSNLAKSMKLNVHTNTNVIDGEKSNGGSISNDSNIMKRNAINRNSSNVMELRNSIELITDNSVKAITVSLPLTSLVSFSAPTTVLSPINSVVSHSEPNTLLPDNFPKPNTVLSPNNSPENLSKPITVSPAINSPGNRSEPTTDQPYLTSSSQSTFKVQGTTALPSSKRNTTKNKFYNMYNPCFLLMSELRQCANLKERDDNTLNSALNSIAGVVNEMFVLKIEQNWNIDSSGFKKIVKNYAKANKVSLILILSYYQDDIYRVLYESIEDCGSFVIEEFLDVKRTLLELMWSARNLELDPADYNELTELMTRYKKLAIGAK